MPLEIESRRVGDIMVVKCIGRLVAGRECESLQKQMIDWMTFDRHFILDLGEVPFVDSSGLGTLVRLLGRAHAAHGNLKLCSMPKQVQEVLKVTSLDRVFDSYETVSDAVAQFYRSRPAAAAAAHGPAVLCLHTSSDLLAYVREVLNGAGYNALTATNLLDGRVLLAATRPALVIISSKLRALSGSQAADGFRKLAESLPIVELNDNFSSEDAAEAARALLTMVTAAIGAPKAAAAK